MERACFIIEIKPGMEAEYDRRHVEVWPDLLAVLSDSGVRNYTLFRRGSMVVAYCECHPSVSDSFDRVGRADVNARWSQWFEDVIERLTDSDGNLLWAAEVWHQDLGSQ